MRRLFASNIMIKGNGQPRVRKIRSFSHLAFPLYSRIKKICSNQNQNSPKKHASYEQIKLIRSKNQKNSAKNENYSCLGTINLSFENVPNQLQLLWNIRYTPSFKGYSKKFNLQTQNTLKQHKHVLSMF